MEKVDFDWRKPDYASVYQARVRNLARIRADKSILPRLKAYYKENPADFISDFGVTYDPRNADIGLPTLIPFVLFPRQRAWVQWVMDKWRNRDPGLCEKSRDMGVSWLAMSLSCTICLFHEGVAIGVGSRKGEYVDKVGTLKPLLPKARIFMENLPPEFVGDWQAWRDAPSMRINFPATRSFIGGEGGDDIGRGDRTSIYFVDEAQPLIAKILTPVGWQLMADMRPGHTVIGRDGKHTKVTHINDCGVHDVFRFTFSDGTSAECSPNHLWTVDKSWGKRERLTMRAHEIAERFAYQSPGGQIQYLYRIPTCEPVQFDKQKDDLPLDPYVVGALLGDGSIKGGVVRLTSADSEIVQMVARRLPDGIQIGAFDGRYSYNIVDRLGRQGRASGGIYIQSRARLAVAAAGIAGLGAADKFIPDAYKFSSPEDRLCLLQGLLDTDGSATGGSASFYTTSMRLAEDVRFIVQSLGGTATHNVKPDARGYKPVHDIHLTLPAGMNPFKLERKLRKLRPRQHPPGRTIVAVERIGRQPVRCITVAAADGLYLTDNFIVTHNSAHLERPELVDASLSQTTNCRIDMSSVRGMNNPFARKRHEGKIDVFIFDWRGDPRKDEAWYEKQTHDLDPVVVAQEIDRDYQASVTGVVIPAKWAKACIDAREKLGIAPSGRVGLALDIADEGVDKNAACRAHGTEILSSTEWSGKGADIFDTVEEAFRICDEFGIDGFEYDADGLGAGVRGDARVLNEARVRLKVRQINVQGFRGSEGVFKPDAIVPGTLGLGDAKDGRIDKGRTNKDYFQNRKAQGAWELRRRARNTYRWLVEGIECPPDEILSISSKCPNHMKLIAEMSQPTYSTGGTGKIQINKKPDGMKSPNLYDAAMIRFAPKEAPATPISAEMVAQVIRSGRRR